MLTKRLLCVQRIVCSLLFFLLVQLAWSQGKLVTGKVVDAKEGTPVIGASITFKGSKKGTTTNSDGEFTITVPANVTTIVVTSVGYTRREIAITGTDLQVLLNTDNDALGEVVVIGYGTQRKKEVTGAISKVGADKITALPTPSFEASLQGRVPGVQVSQSSGLAGAASYVRIRGIASVSAGGDPLYVIDGIPVTSDVFAYATGAGGNEWKIRAGFSQNPLASINPNDIESVEILKDAGAAGIYGSRGANGVILITTKRGKAGKPLFNFSSKWGVTAASVKPKLVNTEQWIQLRQEAYENDGHTGIAPLPSNIPISSAMNTNTDWFDEVTRNGFLQDYNLSMTAGSKKVKYFIGGSFSDDHSYAVGNKFTRAGLRGNIDYAINSKLKALLNLSWSRGDNYRIPSGWAGGIGAALSTSLPFYPADRNAPWHSGGLFWDNMSRYNNPLIQIDETKWRSLDNRYLAGLTLDYALMKNLYVKVSGNVDYLKNDQDKFESAYLRSSTTGVSERYHNDIFNYNVNATATYRYDVNSDNHFAFLLGTEYQHSQSKAKNYSYTSASATGPFWKNEGQLDSAILSVPNGNAQGEDRFIADQFAFISYFARVNYNWKNKLFLQALARVDGSSKFGPNNKFGFFPAVSAAYMLSDEEFFIKALPQVNLFKLRASFGITGNANIPSFLYLGRWNYQRTGTDLYNGQPILYPVNYENPDLKWERLANFDAGLEIGILNNRITGEFGYYHKLTSDVLMEQFLSESNGIATSYYRNLGKVKNQGVEIGLIGEVAKTKDLTWSLSFNVAKNTNEVLDTKGLGPDAIRAGTNETRIVEGYPLGSSYTIVYMGTDPADGLPIWLDPSGKETKVFPDIQYARRVVGKLIPDWTGGFGTNVKYKNWELNALFVFSTGLDIWDNSGKFQFQGVSQTQNWNFREEFLDHWQKPGDVKKYPRLYYDKLYPGLSAGYAFSSSLFLYEGDYLRLRELTIGYNMTPKILKKAGVKNARLFVTGMNLLLWTKYANGDPEVNRDADGGVTDRNMSPNVTYLTPPQAKSILFGLNLSF